MFTPLSSPTLRSNRPGSRRTHLARVVAWATATVVTVAGGAAAAAVATQSPGPGGPDAPAAGAGASATSPRVDCAVAKCVALTFDDGPGPYTGRLLSDLKAANAKATFFVLGKQAQGNPGMIRRLHEAGMVVGSHGWDHKAFSKLTAAQQRAQLDRTARAIQDAGAPRPTLFRPPYGAANSATKKLGVPLILWNVHPGLEEPQLGQGDHGRAEAVPPGFDHSDARHPPDVRRGGARPDPAAARPRLHAGHGAGAAGPDEAGRSILRSSLTEAEGGPGAGRSVRTACAPPSGPLRNASSPPIASA